MDPGRILQTRFPATFLYFFTFLRQEKKKKPAANSALKKDVFPSFGL
jgi:hypothetical protein